jgi:phosphoglycerate kinase
MIIRKISNLEDDLTNKVALVRVDYNVPIIEGKISDYSRINSSLESIQYLIDRNAKIVLITHFGRPDRKVCPALSLAFLVPELTRILKKPVKFSYNHVGHEPKKIIEQMSSGDILLLENIRFNESEEDNNDKFAAEIASLGDFYINEAFSCSHRPHASIVSVPKYIPGYAGFSFLKEIDNLGPIVKNNAKDTVGIIGGAKVSTKLKLLKNLGQKLNKLVIAGAMANTFLEANGVKVGSSFFEEDLVETAKKIAAQSNSEIILPCDFVCINVHNKDIIQIKSLNELNGDDKIMDIGPLSIFNICNAISNSQNLIWNGPVGVFEDPRFAVGTDSLARFIGAMTHSGKIKSVAGGGDTISAINNTGMLNKFTYISTAGGAFLELLEGNSLPGIQALITP